MMMDKKSFMRGFGAGVLFAAVILGTSCLLRTSDAAVIRKAKQLGMTYAVKEEPLFRTSAPVSGGAASVPDAAPVLFLRCVRTAGALLQRNCCPSPT